MKVRVVAWYLIDEDVGQKMKLMNPEILRPQEPPLGCRPPWHEQEGQPQCQEEVPCHPPVLKVAN